MALVYRRRRRRRGGWRRSEYRRRRTDYRQRRRPAWRRAVARQRHGLALVGAAWLVIGVLVASQHHLTGGHGLHGLVVTVASVLLWPLVLLGARF